MLGLGGIGIRKKWGSPLGLPRIVLWVVRGWSSRQVLCLWSVLGCNHRGLPHIGDSWIVGLGLFGWACVQSVEVLPICSLQVSNARMHRLARNPKCRAERTSLDCVFVLCPTSI